MQGDLWMQKVGPHKHKIYFHKKIAYLGTCKYKTGAL